MGGEASSLVKQLEEIFLDNSNKRIIVVGTTCTGKSFLIKHLKNSLDMDDLVFPLLTPEEAAYVCQTPWTEEIGKTMSLLVKTKIKVQKGHPVFGTVVLDSDLIVYLKISDALLKERCILRNANFVDAKNMQAQIESEIKKSSIPVTEVLVG